MSNVVHDVYLGVYYGSPDHHALWVDIGATTTLKPENKVVPKGLLLNVIGSVQQGMTYEEKMEADPAECWDGKEKIKVGTVRAADLDTMKQICRQLPPPPKQYDGPKKIDPKKPPYNCQNWTKDVTEVLKGQGILRG